MKIVMDRAKMAAHFNLFLYFFSLRKRIPYVITRDVCPSVCPSLGEITLINGCTISISIRPILFKFGLNIKYRGLGNACS